MVFGLPSPICSPQSRLNQARCDNKVCPMTKACTTSTTSLYLGKGEKTQHMEKKKENLRLAFLSCMLVPRKK